MEELASLMVCGGSGGKGGWKGDTIRTGWSWEMPLPQTLANGRVRKCVIKGKVFLKHWTARWGVVEV